MFLSRHVANSVISACRERGIADITPLKLQKIIYFLHGWHLVFSGKPAVSERFFAWRYGPVLDSVYREFRHFGSAPITAYATDFDPESKKNFAYVIGNSTRSGSGKQFNEILEKVLDSYGSMDGLELSALTHAQGSPWAKTPLNNAIDDNVIEQYFKALTSKSG
jgi:uncharacterized phage-associated protein